MPARIFLLLQLWLGIVASTQAAVIVKLEASTIQNTIALSLGEIVQVSGANALLEDMMRSFVLPTKGKVGDTVTYTRSELERLVNTTHPELAAQLRWSGAERILIQRRGVTIAPQQYIDWAQDQLVAHWAANDGHFILQPINDYRALAIPSGRYSVTARFEGNAVRRTTKVWLDISVDQQYYTSIAVLFDVRWLHSGLVLNEHGSARQHLMPTMVSNAEIDISLLKSPALTDMEQLAGKRLRHDVAPGVPLSISDIEVKPAVELGDTVSVVTKVGRIAVQTQAIAERDGCIGQRIGVKNSHSNAQLTVDVIGEHLAAVSENQGR